MSKYIGKDPYSDIEKQKGRPNGVPSLDSSGFLVQGHAFGGILGNIKTYTSNSTWFKPDNLRFVIVTIVGGGAGGGTGRISAQPALSGPGGGAGGIAIVKIDAANLNDSESVVVGEGGAGASGAELLNGAPGGDSSFGSHVIAYGGQPGAAGAGYNGGKGGAGGNVFVAPTAQGIYVAQGHAGEGRNSSNNSNVRGVLGGAGFLGAGVGQPGGYQTRSEDSAPNTGAGGSGAPSNNTTAGAGGSGIVIVYEYF